MIPRLSPTYPLGADGWNARPPCHGYFLVDKDEAGKTAVVDIPSLLEKISQFPQ